MKTGFRPMRTICKGCGKMVFVDYWMVEYKRCQDCCIKDDEWNEMVNDSEVQD